MLAKVAIVLCRTLVRSLRQHEYVLTTTGFGAYYDIGTSTMLLIGGKGTGTHLHVDISEGFKIAFEILKVLPHQ